MMIELFTLNKNSINFRLINKIYTKCSDCQSQINETHKSLNKSTVLFKFVTTHPTI